MSNLTFALQAAALTALNGSGSFLYQSAEQAELSAQDHALPLIVCYDFTTSQTGPASRVEAAGLTLYFADARPGASDDPVEHHAAVARMEALKRRFLAALDAGPLVQLDGIRATPFTGYTSSELDGVGCQLTLTVPAASLCVTAAPAPAPAPFASFVSVVAA